MNNQLKIFVLFGILISGIGAAPAFSEDGSVFVSTDKSSYSEGETISISGEVKYLAMGNQVSLMIQAPNGNIVYIGQLIISSDNQFSTEINPGGQYWKTSGTYTVQITQNEKHQANTSFEFGGIVSPTPGTVIQGTLPIQGSTDLISYEITNGKIISVIPDLDAISLLIYIEATGDGSVTLTIPRSVLDATINGDDTEFFVLVDDEETEFDEIRTSVDRKLTIPFSAGAEQIEIIGTFVIPEFGTIAAMILAVAIISIIAISAKSRLSIVPRY